ncbi:MAG: SH3 domain-containing protein [Deltaproteobacteria bacterium]
MTARAAPSPAWLGLFGALSFGGLVLASFASGYHLVMKSAQQGLSAAPADSPAGSDPAANAPASSNGSSSVAQSGSSAPSGSAAPRQGAGALTPSGSNPSDPAEAIVRPNLRPDRARVRSRPDSGAIVGRLPSNQRVAVRGRDGQWLHIEFDRNGKHVDGWTQESNLLLR